MTFPIAARRMATTLLATTALVGMTFAQSNSFTASSGNSSRSTKNVVNLNINPDFYMTMYRETKKMSDAEVKEYLVKNNQEGYLPILEVVDGMIRPAVKWYKENPSNPEPLRSLPYAQVPYGDPQMAKFIKSIENNPLKLSIALNLNFYYEDRIYLSAFGEVNRGGNLSVAVGALQNMPNIWTDATPFKEVIIEIQKDAASFESELQTKPLPKVMRDLYNRSKSEMFKNILVSFWPNILDSRAKGNVPSPSGN
jgi:hypothetical protein